MIGRLVAMGTAVAAAAAGVGAAAWAKRRAAEDTAIEQEMLEAVDDHEEIISTPVALPDPQPAGEAAPGASDDGDDLTVVKGIGAVRAHRLNEVGVTTYVQLASWTDEDLETVAAKIKVSPERIRHEDWVGQARTRIGA